MHTNPASAGLADPARRKVRDLANTARGLLLDVQRVSTEVAELEELRGPIERELAAAREELARFQAQYGGFDPATAPPSRIAQHAELKDLLARVEAKKTRIEDDLAELAARRGVMQATWQSIGRTVMEVGAAAGVRGTTLDEVVAGLLA